MSEIEKNIVQKAIAWYRYILRSGEFLNKAEQELFDAVLEMQVKKRESKRPKNYGTRFDELPTVPIPHNMQNELIDKSKKDYNE